MNHTALLFLAVVIISGVAKFYVKRVSLKFSKTAEMLDEDKFWSIVNKSVDPKRDQDSQESYLIKQIEKLSPKEIVGFRLRTDKLLHDTYTSEMWCAAYIMNGGCSDDSFEYFRCWLISRGREVFNKAKTNPDYLINEVVEGVDSYDFENFWYVALKAFEKNTGKNLYDYIDQENFKTKEGHYPKLELTWREDDPKSMKKICPKLFSKFNSASLQ
jgi:hypothetical protein